MGFRCGMPHHRCVPTVARLQSDALTDSHCGAIVGSEGDVVLAAIRECPMALEFASDLLRKDHDFIVTAVRVSARAAGCVTEDIGESAV